MQSIIGSQYPEIVIKRINEAKQQIEIVMFDWRWYFNDPGSVVQLFNQSIIRAVRRGVRVRAITNFPDIIKTLQENGVEAKKLQTQNLVHAKIIIIDKKEAIIGSHNFTSPAFEKNYELSALIDDQSVVSDYFNYFEKIWL